MTATATATPALPERPNGANPPGATAAGRRVTYLVHDVSDAAVQRRVRMLKAGGATVTLAGFHRADAPPVVEPGVEVVNFGQTQPGKLAARALSVLSVLTRARRLEGIVRGADAIVCRNLEMLAVGSRLRSLFAPGASLVYESLDIHRVLLSGGPEGHALRWLERRLARDAALVLTSSPAFVKHYFRQRNPLSPPTRLVENKVFAPDGVQAATSRRPGPPWRIGWYGNLRCQRSLDILCAVASQADGAVEVVLRGRPALQEFRGFMEQIGSAPHVRYEGTYRNPEELAGIYGDVHFSWAIDFFEEGLNSDWLLPNRLYEGGLYGAVPIALAGVETGAWLRRHGIGLLLDTPEPARLGQLLAQLDPAAYQAMGDAVAALPSSTWISERQECANLVSEVVGASSSPA